jgi:pimeloyl-ACP methyl ester carboxylesterase
MTDAPLIVLLPGLDGTGRLFGEFADRLSAQHEVRVLRYPADEALGYEALTRWVQAALPAERRCVLVAESFSGPIGCALAAQRMPGLIGLVLCASFSSSPLPWLRPLAGMLRFAPVRAVPMRLLAWVLLGRWATPPRVAGLRSVLAEVEPAVLRRRAQAALTASETLAPPAPAVPVLYLQATADRLVRRGAARRLRASFPATEVLRVPGPHFLLQAEPERCARLVSEFVRRAVVAVRREAGETQPAISSPVARENPGAMAPDRR